MVGKNKFFVILLVIFLFSLFLIEARDPDDPIVSGDDVPILGDAGENILKNKTEPVEKDRELPQEGTITIYQPPAEKLNSLEEFKNKYGEPWKVRWDEKHGTVDSIHAINYDTSSKLNTEEDIDKISKIILKDSKNLFDIDNVDSLEIRDIYHTTINNRELWEIKYHQMYEGVPVYQGYVGLGFRDTILTGISSQYYPVSVSTTTPKISKESALEIALNSYGSKYEVFKNSSELIILPFEVFDENSTESYLAWKVYVNILNPLISDNVYVDAIMGDIIYKQNKLVGSREKEIFSGRKVMLGILTAFLFVLFIILIILIKKGERKIAK